LKRKTETKIRNKHVVLHKGKLKRKSETNMSSFKIETYLAASL